MGRSAAPARGVRAWPHIGRWVGLRIVRPQWWGEVLDGLRGFGGEVGLKGCVCRVKGDAEQACLVGVRDSAIAATARPMFVPHAWRSLKAVQRRNTMISWLLQCVHAGVRCLMRVLAMRKCSNGHIEYPQACVIAPPDLGSVGISISYGCANVIAHESERSTTCKLQALIPRVDPTCANVSRNTHTLPYACRSPPQCGATYCA